MSIPLDQVFAYQKVDESQITAMDAIRIAAHDLATVIERVCPDCVDRSVSIRILRECVFTANAAISLKGMV